MNTPLHNQKDDRLAKRVFDRIEGEHLTPRPRWEFLFKNYFFWGIGILAVVFGALAVSATLFEVTNIDWRLSVATHPDFMTFLLAVAPYFWVIALALFVLIGYMNVRSTNHGYRYPLILLVLGAVFTSLSLGGGLYAAGLGGEVEAIIGDHPPFYRPIVVQQRSWWLAPEKGLLGGHVTRSASSSPYFIVRDFKNQTWKVDGSDLSPADRSAVSRGGEVRIVGLPTRPDETLSREGGQRDASSTLSKPSFHACFVFSSKLQGKLNGEVTPVITESDTDTEGTSDLERCKEIKPYEQLRSIDESGD